jgi:hypothetical protein
MIENIPLIDTKKGPVHVSDELLGVYLTCRTLI